MKPIAKYAFTLAAVIASVTLTLPAFAQSTSGYEWRTDDTGTYLYVTGTHPVRVYAKDVRDIRIVEETPAAQNAPIQTAVPAAPNAVPAPNHNIVLDQTAVQNGIDPISPFGPREKFLQYYIRLNDIEKKLYEKLYFALLNHEESCHFDSEVENKNRVVWAIYNDHPELFWLERTYSVTTTYDNQTSYDFKLKYIDFDEPLEQSRKKVEAVVNVLVQEASKLDSDIEKERFVHDYLVMNTRYDKTCPYRSSEYGALVNRCAVCEGFSQAFQHIMLKLGIQAVYIPGVMEENGTVSEHAWNQVILNGQCHNVDVTADEFPPDEDFGNKERLARYIYFNLSDDEFESLGYRRDSDVKSDEVPLPICRQSAPIEDMIGLNGMIKAFSYFNMTVDSAVHTIDDYYSLMYNEIVQSKSNKIRVFALIKGEDLYSTINELTMKEKKKGYLSKAWKKSFNTYSSANTSLTTYRISPNVWLILTEVIFSK